MKLYAASCADVSLQVALDIVAVHVQEGALHGLSSEAIAQHESELEAAVRATGFTGTFECLPLHAALPEGTCPGPSEQPSAEAQDNALKELVEVSTGYGHMEGAGPELGPLGVQVVQ